MRELEVNILEEKCISAALNSTELSQLLYTQFYCDYYWPGRTCCAATYLRSGKRRTPAIAPPAA